MELGFYRASQEFLEPRCNSTIISAPNQVLKNNEGRIDYQAVPPMCRPCGSPCLAAVRARLMVARAPGIVIYAYRGAYNCFGLFSWTG